MRILNVLTAGKMCVSNLVAVLDLPQSTVSRQLAYLRRTNLVTRNRCGRFVCYSLAAAQGQFHKEIINCVHRCFPKIPLLREERLIAVKHNSLHVEHPCHDGRGELERP